MFPKISAENGPRKGGDQKLDLTEESAVAAALVTELAAGEDKRFLPIEKTVQLGNFHQTSPEEQVQEVEIVVTADAQTVLATFSIQTKVGTISRLEFSYINPEDLAEALQRIRNAVRSHPIATAKAIYDILIQQGSTNYVLHIENPDSVQKY